MKLISNVMALLRGISQLRHPALVRWLGASHMEAELVEAVRRHNPGASVEYGVIIKGWRKGLLSLGCGVKVCRGAILSCNDSAHGHGRITIGDGTWIGQYNNIRTCPNSDIVIGKNCLISQFCTLVGSNHGIQSGQSIKDQPMDTRRTGVILGDDVWLGAGVTILPGVTISSGAVVAANSVVTHDVPPNEIWAGSPAVFKGKRSAIYP